MFSTNLLGRIWFGVIIINIIGVIFSMASIVKFEVFGNDYRQFLMDAYDYNVQILETMDKLQEQGELEKVLECGKQAIDDELINIYWYYDIFDWSETSFAPQEVLEKLNYWRETGQIPAPNNSKTDYEEGIQSV